MYPFGPFGEVPDPPERRPTEPEQVMPEGDLRGDPIDLVLHDPVLRFRAQQFAGMSFTPRQSRALALDKSVDVHWVRDVLINRGCEPHIAFDIASS